jgi:hypothetical protein
MKKTGMAVGISLAMLAGTVTGGEREDLIELRATTLKLIDVLVEEGIFTREKADQLVQRARQAADQEIRAAAAAGEVVEEPPADKTVVRVPYVPEFVKDEIRAQVREELRADVTQDIVGIAQKEKWGTKDALPGWLSRIEFNGDMRLRYQGDYFASGNDLYFDWDEINGGATPGTDPDAFLNSTHEENRARARLRVGMDAQVNDSLKAGVRLTSGNTSNPVSTNQTLGNTGNRWNMVIDRAYLQYNWEQDHMPGHDPQTLTLLGGRFGNPFMHTDMVWDSDLGFEGVAATYSTGYGKSSWNDHYLPSVFATLGGFMIEDTGSTSCSDKYLMAAQAGGEWSFYDGRSDTDDTKLKVAIAYYDYENMEAVRNAPDTFLTDCTAPEFMQKGNSLAQVSNITGAPSASLVGLASDFNIVNLTAEFDYAMAHDLHAIFTADYAMNIGFDEQEVLTRTQTLSTAWPDRTDAWHVRSALGHSNVRRAGNWQAFAGYKYIEADAVLDAFNDSDFHLGGTDAKGFYLGGSYGLMNNAWLTAKWMSADEIDGFNGTEGPVSQKLGIDTFQLDLNARF